MAAGDDIRLDDEVPSSNRSSGSVIGSFVPPTEPPDSRTRRIVSYLLLALLAAVVIAAFVELFAINHVPVPELDNSTIAAGAVAADTAADADRLMQLMNMVFGPVVTLVSSVVGFYFGARTAREAGNG